MKLDAPHSGLHKAITSLLLNEKFEAGKVQASQDVAQSRGVAVVA